jgi:hypothetical protein
VMPWQQRRKLNGTFHQSSSAAPAPVPQRVKRQSQG